LRGRLTIIAISTVLLLGNSGFYTTPTFGGSSTFIFDGGPGGTGQDWNTAANWDLDALPSSTDPTIIPPTFDVNINSPDVVQVGDISQDASLTLVSGSTLTIKDGATLNHFALSTSLIRIDPGSTLTVDGDFNNNSPADIFVLGLLVVTDTGSFVSFGDILGTGEIQCVGNGTFDQQGTIAGTITVTDCGGAAVGSISIPLDSTSLLVAGNQINSIWITLAIISAVGVGAVIATKRLKN